MIALTDFLLARIAEDEAVARDFGKDEPGAIPDSELWVTEADHPAISITAARVLAECEAKRRTVARVAPFDNIQVRRQTRTLAGDVLRALALPYADHPDYREEWRS